MAHPFNFTQGEKFSRMGASWFVSYCYDDVVPAQLGNWNRIRSAQSRISLYNRTKFWVVDGSGMLVARCNSLIEASAIVSANPNYERLHRYWMRRVLWMNAKKVNRNSIGLNYSNIQQMVSICLPLL